MCRNVLILPKGNEMVNKNKAIDVTNISYICNTGETEFVDY